MISFIIRRVISMIFLLVVVSIITFAIFFLIPRLAGQNASLLRSSHDAFWRPPSFAALKVNSDARG